MIIATHKGKIIFWKHFGKDKRAIEYLLGYSALDTEEALSVDGYASTTTVLESGHKVVVVNRSSGGVSRSSGEAGGLADVQQLVRRFKEAIMNPFVDCEGGFIKLE